MARRDTWTIERLDYELEEDFRAAVVDELARFEHIGYRQGFGIVAAPVRERLDGGGIVTHAWEFTSQRIPLINRDTAPEPVAAEPVEEDPGEELAQDLGTSDGDPDFPSDFAEPAVVGEDQYAE